MITWRFENIVKYANRSNTTREPNDTCFIIKQRNGVEFLLIQGFPCYDKGDILKYFDISESKLYQLLMGGTPIQEIAKDLKWKPFKRKGVLINNKGELLTVLGFTNEEYISMLACGKSNFAVMRAASDNMKLNPLRLKSLEEKAKFMVGKTRISISRETGNKDKNTFDFVTVTIDLCGIYQKSKSERMDEVKSVHKYLTQYALQRIEDSNKFKKYGVPINLLKLDKCFLCHDDVIEYTFGIKEA